jgi:hypothetical protein
LTSFIIQDFHMRLVGTLLSRDKFMRFFRFTKIITKIPVHVKNGDQNKFRFIDLPILEYIL